MRIGELGSSPVFTVEADDLIDVAIDLMEEHQIHHLPVLRDGIPVGLVSERDLLFHVDWQRISERASKQDSTVELAGPTHIREIMSTPLVSLSPDDPAQKAARLMLNKGLHGIALITERSVTSMVTQTDFLRCYSGDLPMTAQFKWSPRTVSDYMSRDVVCVEPREKTFAALRLMQRWQIRHLPVIDDGKLVGIVSDHDIRRGLARDTIENVQEPRPHIGLMENHGVENIMSRDVESTAPTATLAAAAEQMVRRRFGSLPVTEGDRLVGIITETDLLRALLAACEAE